MKCQFVDYNEKKDTTCQVNQEEVYVHCKPNKLVEKSHWTEWNDNSFCTPNSNYHRQVHRKCVSEVVDSKVTFCPGRWLKVIKSILGKPNK